MSTPKATSEIVSPPGFSGHWLYAGGWYSHCLRFSARRSRIQLCCICVRFIHAVSSGATLAVAPTRQPWGQLVAFLHDPDGLLIEVCGPVGG